MQELVKIVEHFFEDRGLNSRDHRFLLACSGGIDSMVLADICLKLKLNLGVAHCNFQLRGEESNKDQALVQDYAQEYQLPFHVSHFNTSKYASEHGVSIQMAARELRYNFFHDLMQNRGFDFLLTAHHLDDSLETLLINVGRGTGVFGLGGIPLDRDQILRPLNGIEKQEIREYAERNTLKWREDKSNMKDDYQRNFLRHHVSPKLKEASSNFSSGFKNSLKLIGKDLALYKYFLQNTLEEISYTKEDQVFVELKRLMQLPSPSSFLHFWLNPFGRFDISAIEGCLTHESGKVFEAEAYILLKDRTHLILQPKRDSSEETQFWIAKDNLKLLEPIRLQIEVKDNKPIEIPTEKSIVALDFHKLQFPLQLRKWKEGDRFTPLGMQQSKKLSDFFIDQKLSIFDKSAAWLLCSGDDIVWIIGHRINEHYKITNKTKSAYFVRLLK